MIGGCLSLVVSAMFLGASPISREAATCRGSSLPSTSTATSKNERGTTLHREFVFVPYGATFPDDLSAEEGTKDRPTITCDGRITRTDGGQHLELTHWTNHQTPRALYADTSTEIALNLAKLRQKQRQENEDANNDALGVFDNALVINNHFDSDGALSVWSCMDPEAALKHADLLVQGAEAGDFGEWSSDNGVKLDCTLLALASEFSSDEAAYEDILPKLPNILDDFETTGGQSYEHLWRSGGWDQAVADWQDIQEERVKLERYKDSKIVLVHEKEQSAALLSPYALDRGLREAELWSGTTRILRVTQQPGDSKSYTYEYKKIGHGWIQEVVQRHEVPDADKDELVQKLQDRSNDWTTGGSLVSICQTRKSCAAAPSEIAHALVCFDRGAT